MKKIITGFALLTSVAFFGQTLEGTELKVTLATNNTDKNVARIIPLGFSGITGARNWALRGAYQYWNGIHNNAIGGDLDLIKSLDRNTILATKTDGTALGNVGIGTTSPQSSLHIKSALKNIDNFIITTSPTGEVPDNIFTVSNQNGSGVMKMKSRFGVEQVAFNTEGNSYLKGGNLGIGTANPISKLHVYHNSASVTATTGLTIEQNGTGDSQVQYLLTGVQRWVTGVDNSDGDKFIIGRGANWGNGKDLTITKTGNVAIGNVKPNDDSKLAVEGTIHCEEVQVDLDVAPDYVFQKYYTGASELKDSYTMPTLEEVEAYTKENHHLPSVPSAKTIQEEGLHLKEVTSLLLQKIEELTLYTIEQNKELKTLKEKVSQLENK